VNIMLPQEAQLQGGSYWLVVYITAPFSGGNQWFWSTQAAVNGNESKFKDEANLISGATDWLPASVALGNVPSDQRFQIFGVSSDSNSSTVETESALATLNTDIVSVAWPNPSSNKFNFNLNSLPLANNVNVSLRVFNINGQLVYRKDNLDSSKEFSWDASSEASGIYLISLKGADFSYKTKLIKQ